LPKLTPRDVFQATKTFLKPRLLNPPTANMVVERLLSDFIGREPIYLLTHSDQVIDKPLDWSEYCNRVERLAMGEHLPYILGWCDFGGIRLKIGPGAFIPSPETENIVREALRLKFKVPCSFGYKDFYERQPRTFLDLCTGIGAIAFALAWANSSFRIDAVENFEDSGKYARENMLHYYNSLGFYHRFRLLAGDIFNLPYILKANYYDVITANPPYTPSDKVQGNLPKRVLQSGVPLEPKHATDGGPDGMNFIRKIIDIAPYYLISEGFLLMEIGPGQSRAVIEYAKSSNAWQNPEILNEGDGVASTFKGQIKEKLGENVSK
jgi:release factor glutamine methyltransferase